MSWIRHYLCGSGHMSWTSFASSLFWSLRRLVCLQSPVTAFWFACDFTLMYIIHCLYWRSQLQSLALGFSFCTPLMAPLWMQLGSIYSFIWAQLHVLPSGFSSCAPFMAPLWMQLSSIYCVSLWILLSHFLLRSHHNCRSLIQHVAAAKRTDMWM